MSCYFCIQKCSIGDKKISNKSKFVAYKIINCYEKKCSWSGKRDSNPPPTAWKAVALPDELLPHKKKQVGEEGFEPPKA